MSDDEGVSDLTERDALLPQEKTTPGTTEYAARAVFSFREPWEGWWSGEGRQRGVLWQPHLAAIPPRHSSPQPEAGLWQNNYACTWCPPLPKPHSVWAVGTGTPPCPIQPLGCSETVVSRSPRLLSRGRRPLTEELTNKRQPSPLPPSTL